MNKSLLVKLAGFPATLMHGDPMVLDRWLWLRRRLPETRNNERLLEIGCGSGAFTIGAALRGYHATGLSWDARNQAVARERAELCGASNATFEVVDVRRLDEQVALQGFDVIVACEVIEHVLDDRKLMLDMAACLKPGGRLLLTAPNHVYVPLAETHKGPFSTMEDGGHVRRGYSKAMLAELCTVAGLTVSDVTFCSGLVSQKLSALHGQVRRLHSAMGWAMTLPLRALPPVVDPWLASEARWPSYSICLEAYKPRFPN